MRTSARLDKRNLMKALAVGIVFLLLFKLYLYRYDRAQFDDSNLLVTVVFVAMVTSFMYVVLELGRSIRRSSK